MGPKLLFQGELYVKPHVLNICYDLLHLDFCSENTLKRKLISLVELVSQQEMFQTSCVSTGNDKQTVASAEAGRQSFSVSFLTVEKYSKTTGQIL